MFFAESTESQERTSLPLSTEPYRLPIRNTQSAFRNFLLFPSVFSVSSVVNPFECGLDIRGAGVLPRGQPIVQKMAKRQNRVFFTRKRAVLKDFLWEDREFFETHQTWPALCFHENHYIWWFLFFLPQYSDFF